MKRSAPAILLSLSLLTTLLFSACLRVQDPNAAKNAASLSEVTTASSVSADGRALASAASFLASTPAVFVSARVNNAPEGTTVGAKWVYVKDESGRTVSQVLSEDSAPARGNQYVSFSRSPATGTWGSGQYSVTMLLNGREVASAPFSVEAIRKAGAQAPTIGYFKALPEAISTGQAVTLSWSVADATSVEVSTIGAVSPAGNVIVTPVNSVEYQLTATNNAGTTTMKVKITVTSFNSDKPELVITDFRVEGDKAYYKVKNIGGVNAKQSTTALYIEGNQRASSLVDILPAGEEREQPFPNFQWTYGTNRTFKVPVRVCADSLNQIGEYDENNNCLVVDW